MRAARPPQDRAGARPYFSGTKLKLDPRPRGRRTHRRARGELAFGTIDSWLMWQLTGGRLHATDVSNAARTLLFDIRTQRLGRRAAGAAATCRASVLPQVHPVEPCARRDRCPPCWARPSRSAASPATSRARCSARPASPGLAKNTYGTGCFMLMHTGDKFQHRRNGLITTAAAQPGSRHPEFALEGSVFIGGAVVQWLRDGLHAIRPAARCRRWPRACPTPAA
jgi:glycerol kinase